jgi:Cu(I)/Ag(I) efflux system membrane fusion protein
MTRIWIAGGVAAAAVAAIGSLLAFPHGDRTDAPASRPHVLYYRDPMHPSYTSRTPGKAPDCGMELVPVYADDAESSRAGDSPETSRVVRVSPERQQMLGVRLGRVEQSRATGTLRALGRVALDETRVFPVIAGGDGWVTGIAPGSTTGSTVRKGQPLVSIYGRDYVTAQRSFLYALQASEHPAPGPSDLQTQTSLTLREARLVLQNLGLGSDQIDELVRTHDVLPETTLTAPAPGVILARSVSENLRFDRGAQLFRIADLHHLWVVADLSRDDEALVRPGDTATLTVANRPELRFRAAVAAALPPFDATSHTFKVRLETESPDLILRPDMFVDVEFSLTLQEAVTVPADAVIQSGRQTIVFVDLGDGNFEPRNVETGSRLGDRIQIVRGLTAGESIAVSGNFLLDSERRMRSRVLGRHD